MSMTEKDWDSFLEMVYRALSMITRWIERYRKRKKAVDDNELYRHQE